jgi:death-on-curing protein
MSPLFLTWDEVLAEHAEQLRRYGGSDGLRDPGLLRSALAQPESSFGGQWLHDDLAAMAAAYAYHVVQNHPFVDGNKRAGAALAILFLALNGQRLEADPDRWADIILAVADSRAAKDDLATFIRQHLRPWTPGANV